MVVVERVFRVPVLSVIISLSVWGAGGGAVAGGRGLCGRQVHGGSNDGHANATLKREPRRRRAEIPANRPSYLEKK